MKIFLLITFSITFSILLADAEDVEKNDRFVEDSQVEDSKASPVRQKRSGIILSLFNPFIDSNTHRDCQLEKHRTTRSITGWCNNLENPKLGNTATAFQRLLLKPSYADGIQSIRTKSVVSGQDLPSARLISNKLNEKGVSYPKYSSDMNNLHMQIGQLVAHDIILMPPSVGENGESLDCSSCSSSSTVSPDCAPIPVPENDENNKTSCLPFTRALSDESASGVRTQINQNTHFLDLSVVYGNSGMEANALRTLSDGKMKIPEVNYLDCQSNNSSSNCFECVDLESCLLRDLITTQTMFLKEHNRIADRIRATSTDQDMSDTDIYQLTRKIMIGMWQHIVYSEYLPTLLPKQNLVDFDLIPLKSGVYKKYNPKQNPSTSAEFSGAAFRFDFNQVESEFTRQSPESDLGTSRSLQKNDSEYILADKNGNPITVKMMEDFMEELIILPGQKLADHIKMLFELLQTSSTKSPVFEKTVKTLRAESTGVQKVVPAEDDIVILGFDLNKMVDHFLGKMDNLTIGMADSMISMIKQLAANLPVTRAKLSGSQNNKVIDNNGTRVTLQSLERKLRNMHLPSETEAEMLSTFVSLAHQDNNNGTSDHTSSSEKNYKLAEDYMKSTKKGDSIEMVVKLLNTTNSVMNSIMTSIRGMARSFTKVPASREETVVDPKANGTFPDELEKKLDDVMNSLRNTMLDLTRKVLIHIGILSGSQTEVEKTVKTIRTEGVGSQEYKLVDEDGNPVTLESLVELEKSLIELIELHKEKVGTMMNVTMQLIKMSVSDGSQIDSKAVNIMRGRDIGLHPYTAYRTLVGLVAVKNWSDLNTTHSQENIDLLKSIYADPADIDLYTGLLLEEPMTGGQLGPTASYIISEQFKALKTGDRFFYENDVRGTEGFDLPEIKELRKATLAKIICDNTEGLKTVKKDIFNSSSSDVACSSFPEINIEVFMEC